MKRAYFISFALILFVAILAATHHQSPETFQKLAEESEANSSVRSIASETAVKSPSFENSFKAEVEAISRLQENPEAQEERLAKWAERLTPSDLLTLKAKTLDPALPGDERILAVYLLSKSKHGDSIEILKDIALTQEPRHFNERIAELERVLRAASVEGIAHADSKERAVTALQEIAQRSPSSFIADRSKRSLHYLRHGGASPEQQDAAALEKLMKSSL